MKITITDDPGTVFASHSFPDPDLVRAYREIQAADCGPMMKAKSLLDMVDEILSEEIEGDVRAYIHRAGASAGRKHGAPPTKTKSPARRCPS